MSRPRTHELKAWRWYPTDEWTVVLFKTGWWLHPRKLWWCINMPPTIFNLRIGPLLIHRWRRRK